MRYMIALLFVNILNAQTLPTTNLLQRLDAASITSVADGGAVTSWAAVVGEDVAEATNTPSFETGEINGLPVVRFVAAGSDHLSAANTATTNLDFGTSDFTIAVLFKSSASAIAGQIILSKNWATGIAGYEISIRRNNDATNGNKIEFAVGVIGGTLQVIYSNTTYANDGNFHRLIVARDSGTMRMWVDGVEQTATASNATNINGNDDFYVGTRQTTDYFSGDIAEIAMYSGYSASLVTEINAYFNCKYFETECDTKNNKNSKYGRYNSLSSYLK